MSFPNLTSQPRFLLLVCLFLLFILLQPKLSSISKFTRANSLTRLTNQIIDKKTLDLKQYWEFREFYSPGSFTSYPLEAVSSPLRNMISSLDPDMKEQLSFQSPLVTSIGGFTTLSSLPMLPQQTLLVQTKTVHYYHDSSNNLVLIFVQPVSEMKKANGFLQHEEDHEETRGDYWLEVTEIRQR